MGRRNALVSETAQPADVGEKTRSAAAQQAGFVREDTNADEAFFICVVLGVYCTAACYNRV